MLWPKYCVVCFATEIMNNLMNAFESEISIANISKITTLLCLKINTEYDFVNSIALDAILILLVWFSNTE